MKNFKTQTFLLFVLTTKSSCDVLARQGERGESFLSPDGQGFSAAQERGKMGAGGNKGRAGATSCCRLSCPCPGRWRKTRRAATREWAQPVLPLYKKALGVPWFIFLFNSMYGASWAPGSVGMGRWMRASSLSRQTESHRESL